MDKLESKRRWREANPDKVAAQIARRRARKAAMSEAEREAYLAKRREALKKYRASIKDDVEKRKKIREDAKRNYRLRRGLPPDAELAPRRQKYATDEERREARLAQKRAAYARRRGLTLEEVAAYNAERNTVIATNKQRRAEDAAKRARKNAEAKAAAERAKRRAAPVVRKAPPKEAQPVNSNDPPELVALFRKASRGQPPIPYNPKGRKMSVFHFRGMR